MPHRQLPFEGRSVVDIAPADKDALRWRRLADTIFSPESPGYLGRTFGNVRGVRRLEGYKLF